MDFVASHLTLKPDEEYHLNDVCLEMSKGNLYTVLGRTLSGKTTLLKVIAGLLTPDSGLMTLNGTEFGSIPVWRRNVAMVYQQFINYPHLTVFDNVAFPLRRRGLPPDIVTNRVDRALEQVGLSDFGNRKIQALSGGQQQRVALARSLVKDAGILLLDEPLVNLDYKLREQLRDEFRGIFGSGAAEDSILIYSSTDPLEAMQLGGDIIVIDKGCILQHGSAHRIFEHPSNTRVAEISNDPAMNLLPGELTNENGSPRIVINDDIRMDSPPHFSDLPPGRYCFGVRAANIEIADAGANFEVELSEISGSETFVHLRNGEHSVIGLLDGVYDFGIGDKVPTFIRSEWLYAFDQNGNLVKSPFLGED